MKSIQSAVPYRCIAQAVKGDVEAVSYVINHFESYMISLSRRNLFDSMGNAYSHIDSDIKRRLETKLIIAILKFDTNRR